MEILSWQSCTTSSATQVLHLFSVHSSVPWATQGNGSLTWFSQSPVLTQPSVCMVILIAWAQCEETLCPALLHYTDLHCVPLPHGSRLMCYENDDASMKYLPKLNNVPLQQRTRVHVYRCSLLRGSRNADWNRRARTQWHIFQIFRFFSGIYFENRWF